MSIVVLLFLPYYFLGNSIISSVRSVFGESFTVGDLRIVFIVVLVLGCKAAFSLIENRLGDEHQEF